MSVLSVRTMSITYC